MDMKCMPGGGAGQRVGRGARGVMVWRGAKAIVIADTNGDLGSKGLNAV